TVGGVQSATIAYKISQNGKDYLFNIIYKYDPVYTNRIFIDVQTTLPANAEVVKFVIGWDTILGTNDVGPSMKIGVEPYIRMGCYNDQGYQMLEYKSGQLWSGYYSGKQSNMANTINSMTLNNTIEPSRLTDTGIGISYNFGSTAGTYTGSSAVLFQCATPRVTPTYSNTNKAINCTAGGADIASGFTGTAGAGYVVRYLDANYNPIGDRTGTTHAPLNVGAAGTYYAAYYDAANDCMSPLTTITVTGTSCSSDVQITADNTNPTCAVKGTSFTIKYKVKNNGTSPTANTVATLPTLPSAAFTYVSNTATAGAFDPATNKWTIPTLASGVEQVLSLTYTARTDATGSINYTSDATVDSGTSPDPTPGNNTLAMTSQYVYPLDNIVANADTGNFFAGDTNTINVLANDMVNGIAATINSNSNTKVTMVSQSTANALSIDANGIITIPSTLPAGTYTLTYNYCYYTTYGSVTMPSACTNCKTATATITLQNKFCYKTPTTLTGGINPSAAISTINARNTVTNWQNNYKGADLVVESKTKGFVINRLTQAQIDAIPSANLLEGMIVYNITTNKMLVYVVSVSSGNGWKEFTKQTCLN
ncbi:DUF11 domain-containing protein, partial [Chryseobacterium artocarpi]|uniref:DUF11 domain-containing protein n=1 Tax=Chryseobacterium artocarpi TaxID=1414727 RepID=UPI003F3EF77A